MSYIPTFLAKNGPADVQGLGHQALLGRTTWSRSRYGWGLYKVGPQGNREVGEHHFKNYVYGTFNYGDWGVF